MICLFISSVLAVSVYKVIPSLNKVSNSLQTIQYYSSLDFFVRAKETPIIEDVKEFKTILYKNLSYSYKE